MNKPLRRVVTAMLVMFGLLIANTTYVQFVKADDYRDDSANPRVLLTEYSHPRGNILVDKKPVATSVKTKDRLEYQRTYPQGPLYAPATGFYSLVYGGTGIENVENDVLAGTDDRLAFSRLSDLFTGHDLKGGNVELTLNAKAQQAAYQAMAKQTGAVVALNPKTGAILAMVSTPSYDPSVVSTHDSAEITKNYKKLIDDPTDPMLNRALRQTYPPGSTFKTVISAAALKAGYKPSDRVPAPDAYQLPTSTHLLHNFDGESCGDGKTDTLAHALEMSCNTAYAELGVKLGKQKVVDEAKEFGIDDKNFSVPLSTAGSSVGDIPDDSALAESSIGQQDVRITPLQGAMIAAAVANHGTLMKPYLVKQIEASNFSVIDSTDPQQLSEPMSSGDADELTSMMEGVVQGPDGTGKSAQIPGIKVAGKTGTADNAPGKPPHAWFIGFAPADDPQVAVAVLIEHGGVAGNETTGGEAAAPIGKAVMQAIIGDHH
ncbi:MAG TPA: penicillin-binding transpeptidase domain-containing protein [Mycobacteriales bacterium]|nr:penicillin-binding transpeptidase domain-containing protein [Mycobacteriales bacterium]